MTKKKNNIVAYTIMYWKQGVHTWELDKQDKAHPGAFLYCVNNSDPNLPEFEPYNWVPDAWLVIEQTIKIHGLSPSIIHDPVSGRWVVAFCDENYNHLASDGSESFCEAVCESALKSIAMKSVLLK